MRPVVDRRAAQQAGKVVRIGLLDYGAPNPSALARWKAFRDRLRELDGLPFHVQGASASLSHRHPA
jgi:hypothetical protein